MTTTTHKKKTGITRPRPDGGVIKKTGITRPRPDVGVKGAILRDAVLIVERLDCVYE